MKCKDKKITKVGNSASLVLDSYMLFASGLKIGDIVETDCKPDKIIITKKKGE